MSVLLKIQAAATKLQSGHNISIDLNPGYGHDKRSQNFQCQEQLCQFILKTKNKVTVETLYSDRNTDRQTVIV